MNHDEIQEIKEAMTPYFVEKTTCEEHRANTNKRLEAGSNNFTALNTQMKFILAGIGAIIVILIPIAIDVLQR